MLNYNSFNLINESIENIDERYAAWIFLFYIYDNKANYKNWKGDSRMQGITVENVLQKLPSVIFINKEEKIEINYNEASFLLDKYFGGNSLQEHLDKTYNLIKYDSSSYKISNIPIDWYLLKNEKISKNLGIISDLKVEWWNKQKEIYISKMKNNPYIKDYNIISAHNYFFPEKIPSEIILYRGISSKYQEKRENIKDTYSSWSLDKSQGEKFAKYYFTGGKQFSPIYNKEQWLLETIVKLSDIIIFYGGEESEVILKNPVKNIKEIKLN